MHKLKIILDGTRNLTFSLVLSPLFFGLFRDIIFITSFAVALGIYIGYAVHNSLMENI